MSKLRDEIKRLMLQAEGELPEANPTWMGMKIDLFSDEVVFDGLAKCAGYVKKEKIKLAFVGGILKDNVHFPEVGCNKKITGSFKKSKKVK